MMSREQETQKIPDVTHYLRHLHSQPASLQLRKTLDLFNATTPQQSHRSFKSGAREFARIANLNYQERELFFGNPFGGLHYSNDLVTQGNTLQLNEKIYDCQINLIAPPDWDYNFIDDSLILAYKGSDPAAALDRLLQGPAVIDCGMFCQLSIWFGIRCVLGNEKFNQLFGCAPFYITQYFYNGIDDPLKPYLGNPLFDFFEQASDTKTASQSVSIAHVANLPEYSLKHPGGRWGGSNSLVLDCFYTKFSSCAQANNLSLQEIRAGLFHAFNEPQNELDQDRIEVYKKHNPEAIHVGYGLTYGELINHATDLADITIEESEFDFPVVCQLEFNYEKFIAWTQQRLQSRAQLDESKNVRRVLTSPIKETASLVPSNTNNAAAFKFMANLQDSQRAQGLSVISSPHQYTA